MVPPFCDVVSCPFCWACQLLCHFFSEAPSLLFPLHKKFFNLNSTLYPHGARFRIHAHVPSSVQRSLARVPREWWRGGARSCRKSSSLRVLPWT